MNIIEILTLLRKHHSNLYEATKELDALALKCQQCDDYEIEQQGRFLSDVRNNANVAYQKLDDIIKMFEFHDRR